MPDIIDQIILLLIPLLYGMFAINYEQLIISILSLLLVVSLINEYSFE